MFYTSLLPMGVIDTPRLGMALDFANTPTALVDDADGTHADLWVPFNFDEIEPPEELQPDEKGNYTLAGEGFQKILQWCWGNASGKNPSWSKAFRKFVVVSALLNPKLVGEQSMPELAKQLGVSKASLSKHAVIFADTHKLKFRNARSKEGREHMRQSRLKQKDASGKVIARTKKKKGAPVESAPV